MVFGNSHFFFFCSMYMTLFFIDAYFHYIFHFSCYKQSKSDLCQQKQNLKKKNNKSFIDFSIKQNKNQNICFLFKLKCTTRIFKTLCQQNWNKLSCYHDWCDKIGIYINTFVWLLQAFVLCEAGKKNTVL